MLPVTGTAQAAVATHSPGLSSLPRGTAPLFAPHPRWDGSLIKRRDFSGIFKSLTGSWVK